MKNTVFLGGSGGIGSYLNPETLSSEADLQLISNDGHYIEINQAVLAAVSQFFATNFLRNQEEISAIITDLSKHELEMVLQFILSGTLSKTPDSKMIGDFAHLGIDLYGFTFDKVRMDAVDVLRVEAKKCPARRKTPVQDAPQDCLVKVEPKEDQDVKADDPLGNLDFYVEDIEYQNEEEDEVSEDGSEYVEEPKGNGPSPQKKKRRTKRGYDNFVGPRNWKLRFQCPDCNFGTDDVGAYKSHPGSAGHFDRCPLNIRARRIYNCLVCDQEIRNETVMREHYKDCHEGKSLKCVVCKRVFRQRRKEFIQHVQKHFQAEVSEGEKYKNALYCVHCGLRCLNKTMLDQHKKRWGKLHTDCCVQCNQSLTSWEEHKEHVAKQHGNRWKFLCGKCNSVFDSKEEVRPHRREAHETADPRRFCELCGKTYKLLKAHVEDVHGTGTFPCTLCNRVLKHENSLKRHMWYHDKGKIAGPGKNGDKSASGIAQILTCDSCGDQFWNSKGLSDHINRVHRSEDERIFQCPDCPKRCFSRMSLAGHKNYAHTKKFRCFKCQKGYATEAERDAHECKAEIKCNICEKVLSNHKYLLHHMRGVHGAEKDKIFQCTYCPKIFAKKQNMKVHLNTHTNARPFHCRVEGCASAFNSVASRNSHEKNSHKG